MATLSPTGLRALLGGLEVESSIPSFDFTDSKNSPMSIYLSYLVDILVQLSDCTPQVAYQSIQWPNESGDLVIVAPRLRIKDTDASELVVDLKKRFPATPLFDHPFEDEINLRVYFHACTLARILLPYTIDRGDLYGKDRSLGLQSLDSQHSSHKKVVVEFSSPNIGKEFDGAHLRSTIIGQFVAALYESMGWDVVRMNFLGDWGKNIGLLAVGWVRFGSEELFEADPLKHLVDVYTKIDELSKDEQKLIKKLRAEDQDTCGLETTGIGAEKDAFFKKMEDGNADALALWKRFRNVTISKYSELYARLNISFDDYSGESEVQQTTTAEVESTLKEKGICEESGGAVIIDFNKHGFNGLGIAILRYSNGTSSYLLRDIAAVLERDRRYSFEKMVYVVSSKQDSHFLQLIKAIELLGQPDLAQKLEHISFGKFKIKGSSQKLNSGHLLGTILDQCRTSIDEVKVEDPDSLAEFHDESAELYDLLSATALMSEELSIKRLSNFTLDISSVANTEGYTGLRLQYWFAKLSQQLKGSTIDRTELERADHALFEEERYADVLRLLIRFPDVVKASFKNLESSGILTYLFQLTDLLPDLPKQVAGGSSQNHAELAFYECVRQVLENGMKIVGLVPVKL